MSGDYLSAHDDGLVENSGRRVAFVYSLTQAWLPHWGGQTLFFDDPDGASAEAYMPQFNSLLLFAVPTRHAVTAVALTCRQVRYAMSGWFHAAPFDH
jgi:Rps23 Pro-64 3,4-dihydroxylase Tpa1-like proline 4-hydroxylase